MADVGIAELLEAGVHFGHQTRRWNPKMRRFIYRRARRHLHHRPAQDRRRCWRRRRSSPATLAHRGGTVLFVGTKKQARDTISDVAEAADMPYVNHRWLGGLLTNFQTINQRIRRLHDLERYEAEGQLALLPTRERMAAQADLAKLRANLGGVKNMQRVPDAMFVIDLKTEVIAVKEAQRLRIPIIGLVDTNCDPDGIDFVIPGNDDAIRSCALITQAIGQVVSEGHSRLPRRGGARAQGSRGDAPASRPRRAPSARPRNRPSARPRSRPRKRQPSARPPREAAAAAAQAAAAAASRRACGRGRRAGRDRGAPAEAAPAAPAAELQAAAAAAEAPAAAEPSRRRQSPHLSRAAEPAASRARAGSRGARAGEPEPAAAEPDAGARRADAGARAGGEPAAETAAAPSRRRRRRRRAHRGQCDDDSGGERIMSTVEIAPRT